MTTWSLIVPTYNRRDVLLRVLPLAFGQTTPPRQVVIADSSDDWQDTRAAVMDLATGWPDIRIDYLHATERSSATQRNLACRHATGDIVVMIDDDSFLYPDYVERLLEVYAADRTGQVVGVNGINVPIMPDTGTKAATGLARKAPPSRGVGNLRQRVMRWRVGRWFSREILFQDMHSLFLKYEGPRDTAVPPEMAGLDLAGMTFMSGHGLSVRREIALAEPLDTSLRYYAALEDLDATYRYGRHGKLLRANTARLHHFEVAGGRIKRKTATLFQLLNTLVFIKRHAADPKAMLPTYRRMLRRRLLGETIKDGLSRRWDFPQACGVLLAMRHWRELWRVPTDQLDDWYPEFQRRLLDEI
ncbi:glycosyltransferase family 2 protein [Paracoccus sp. 1_MG-2023]|uniref:glycosyltransferase family 2 protein n=1 Tax=unclassified Paracoccus (in: a-proteobacteria) TaxID=2688777 RepID=UPI001C088E32|nr:MULTISPECIES: glycosyltransferase family 2 protein [unclassified Paracoccus (in: a-proteobacteria)]MBU2958930.1 glycosyltransferase family 2 protein [Paracoccus sp. C2R09]MDO6669980.1 glycosyltransferase family 2 protein [Paracoccus sp. 1_MG-2023]